LFDQSRYHWRSVDESALEVMATDFRYPTHTRVLLADEGDSVFVLRYPTEAADSSEVKVFSVDPATGVASSVGTAAGVFVTAAFASMRYSKGSDSALFWGDESGNLHVGAMSPDRGWRRATIKRHDGAVSAIHAAGDKVLTAGFDFRLVVSRLTASGLESENRWAQSESNIAVSKVFSSAEGNWFAAIHDYVESDPALTLVSAAPTEDGLDVFRLVGHDGRVVHAAFPNEHWLLTTSVDGTVRRWPLRTPLSSAGRVTVNVGSDVSSMHFEANNSLAVVRSNGSSVSIEAYESGVARIEDRSGGPPRSTGCFDVLAAFALEDEPKAYACHPGRNLLAFARSQFDAPEVWDLSTEPPVRQDWSYDVSGLVYRALAFDNAGSRLAVAWDSGDIDVVEIESGSYLRLTGHEWGAFSVAFTPDGEKLVSGSYQYDDSDMDVRIWPLTVENPADAEVVLAPPSGAVRLAIREDGQFVAASDMDGLVSIWPIGTTAVQERLLRAVGNE
ncbi:MAG: hypothetical protein AAGA95_20540, partial [Pseudomonadota bacterium]